MTRRPRASWGYRSVGPAGQKRTPRCTSNGPSPESLLAGRRAHGGNGGGGPGRQRHALQGGFPTALATPFRSVIRLGEMAGTAQADRAGRDASSRRSRP
jgi:hypothetical protein